MTKRELHAKIVDMVKSRIGDDFYVARDIALSMTEVAMGKMTEKELTQWAEKLRKDDDGG